MSTSLEVTLFWTDGREPVTHFVEKEEDALDLAYEENAKWMSTRVVASDRLYSCWERRQSGGYPVYVQITGHQFGARSRKARTKVANGK